jgi:hypothetical protein
MSNTSGSLFQSLFDAALESYENQTGMKLIDHPLARQLENCHAVDDIMDVLQQQAHAFTEFRGEDGKVKKSLKRAVHILHALFTSKTFVEGVGLVRRMAFLTISNPDAPSIAIPACKGYIFRLCHPTRCTCFPVTNRVSF